jgi:hypothetical protein
MRSKTPDAKPKPKPVTQADLDELQARLMKNLTSKVREIDRHRRSQLDGALADITLNQDQILRQLGLDLRRMEAVQKHIEDAGQKFQQDIAQWVPSKWSSLPLWLDGLDQNIKKVCEYNRAILDMLREIAYGRRVEKMSFDPRAWQKSEIPLNKKAPVNASSVDMPSVAKEPSVRKRSRDVVKVTPG